VKFCEVERKQILVIQQVLNRPFAFAVVCLALVLAVIGRTQQKPAVTLRELVPPNDALSAQDLRFDASAAQLALQYIRSRDATVLEQLEQSPAVALLLNHARNFDYDVPKDSPHALVLNLLASPSKSPDPAGVCTRSLAFFNGAMLDNPHWVNDTLRYLPDGFRFHGTLFLTYGYDIGVAFGPSASLNCTSPHFDGHSRELLYYAIHELHHVGFYSLKPPRKFSDVRTCRDLLWMAQYHTQLEGMAVLAAWQRRREEHALDDDSDYVALQDEPEMKREEALYFEKLKYLQDRGNQPADKEAWAVFESLSAQRLWYRVGARMAQRIEQASGRQALIALIRENPEQFLAAYRKAVAKRQ
jgi:Putative zinc dependent peptidase (DUF5700)